MGPGAKRDGIVGDNKNFGGTVAEAKAHPTAGSVLGEKNIVRIRPAPDVKDPTPTGVGTNINPSLDGDVPGQLGTGDHRDVEIAAVPQCSMHLTLVKEELPIRQTRVAHGEHPGG